MLLLPSNGILGQVVVIPVKRKPGQFDRSFHFCCRHLGVGWYAAGWEQAFLLVLESSGSLCSSCYQDSEGGSVKAVARNIEFPSNVGCSFYPWYRIRDKLRTAVACSGNGDHRGDRWPAVSPLLTIVLLCVAIWLQCGRFLRGSLMALLRF